MDETVLDNGTPPGEESDLVIAADYEAQLMPVPSEPVAVELPPINTVEEAVAVITNGSVEQIEALDFERLLNLQVEEMSGTPAVTAVVPMPETDARFVQAQPSGAQLAGQAVVDQFQTQTTGLVMPVDNDDDVDDTLDSVTALPLTSATDQRPGTVADALLFVQNMVADAPLDELRQMATNPNHLWSSDVQRLAVDRLRAMGRIIQDTATSVSMIVDTSELEAIAENAHGSWTSGTQQAAQNRLAQLQQTARVQNQSNQVSLVSGSVAPTATEVADNLISRGYVASDQRLLLPEMTRARALEILHRATPDQIRDIAAAREPRWHISLTTAARDLILLEWVPIPADGPVPQLQNTEAPDIELAQTIGDTPSSRSYQVFADVLDQSLRDRQAATFMTQSDVNHVPDAVQTAIADVLDAPSTVTIAPARGSDQNTQIADLLNSLEDQGVKQLCVQTGFGIGDHTVLGMDQWAAINGSGLNCVVDNADWFLTFCARINESIRRPHDYVGPELRGIWLWDLETDSINRQGVMPTWAVLPAVWNVLPMQVVVLHSPTEDVRVLLFRYLESAAVNHPNHIYRVALDGDLGIRVVHVPGLNFYVLVDRLLTTSETMHGQEIPGLLRFIASWRSRQIELTQSQHLSRGHHVS